MENRPFSPEEEDDQDNTTSPKKRRGGSALSQYLFRRREQESLAANQETDDDEEDGEEKPKKFRKLLRRIFPSVVERPVEPDKETQPRFNLETWLSWSGNHHEGASEQPAQQPLEQQNFGAGFIDSEEPGSGSSETGVNSNIPDLESEASNAGGSIDTAPVVINTPINPETEIGRTVEAPTSDTGEATPDLVPPISYDRFDRIDPAHRGNPDTVTPDTLRGSSVEREVIIERRGGNALPVVLVGAEYLARKKADKKLEKRVGEKISRSEDEINRGKIAQVELERVVAQNKEQLEALKQARQRPEQVTVAKQSPEVARMPVESSNERSSSRSNELRSNQEIKIDRPEISRTQPVRVESSSEEQPRKIFEQVAEAAENDVPVERVFERSHEVKDDIAIPVGAASVGSVAAAQVAANQQIQQFNSTLSVPPRTPPDIYNLPSVLQPPVDPMEYRKAMQTGFWAAIVIIVLGSIAYLMIK